ncbi:hypothetical protein SAMN04488564_12712 [Lentzea waywayandensis]|uniref:Uncharacterized protein n=1 Tax=Lentzea waywayandensis TaxID=84724 RepID=A0A1I6FJG3_9PSEU|nr:hypothetical protein [Lentzea waywayandensis]SFR30076.1 hypothetical protein SAMN04488564_12712 [Lentzea waywayandensis]
MICWDRCDEDVVGYFDEFEIGVLRDYAESLLRLLDHRARSYRLVGTALAPEDVTTDRRLLALLRAELGAGEPDWVLACQEAVCLNWIADQLIEHLGTLPSSGGVVCLAARSVPTWSRVIRWYLAVIREMTEQDGRAAGKPVAKSVGWFGGIVEGLETQSASSVSS